MPAQRWPAMPMLILDAAVDAEACPLGLAPTASTTAALALGDALALALLDARGFSAEDFARSHPGGALGRKRLLTHVRDVDAARGADVPRVSADGDPCRRRDGNDRQGPRPDCRRRSQDVMASGRASSPTAISAAASAASATCSRHAVVGDLHVAIAADDRTAGQAGGRGGRGDGERPAGDGAAGGRRRAESDWSACSICMT